MKKLRIDCDIAILGNGELIKNSSIVIENSKIKFVGETEHAPSVPDTIQTKVVTPGFWDCHDHYFGMKKFPRACQTQVPALSFREYKHQEIAALVPRE